MKKTTFTTIIVLLCLCFSCSKDNDSSGAGALGVTGSGIYYKFAGGYGYYDLRSGRNITEIFKSNIVDKYDVSWDEAIGGLGKTTLWPISDGLSSIYLSAYA
jgi:hypothetical protein